MTIIQRILPVARTLAAHQPTFTLAEVIAEIKRVHPGVPLNEGTVRCQVAMYCVNAHPAHDGYPDKGASWKRNPHFFKESRGAYRLFNPATDAAVYAAEVARDTGASVLPPVPPPKPLVSPSAPVPAVLRSPSTTKWIIRGIRRYRACLVRDPAHRYRSWEHCFDYFRTFKRTHVSGAAIPDEACVHLSFYLASWGMYRGNAFLLQKDYTTIRPVIEILLKSHYDDLWLNDELTLPSASWQVRAKLMMELADEIKKELLKVKYVNSKGKPSIAKPSMILVTKIMLGTTGCIPAYDRYVEKGLKREGLKPAKAGIRSYLSLLAVLDAYRMVFARAPHKLGRTYPPMKLMDMFLWERGR